MSLLHRCIAVALALTCLLAGGEISTASASPVISEFLAANQGGLKDEDGATPDWIELHNPDATLLDLTSWALTDTVTNLTQWRFPATNLPPGGYLVVFASGENRRIPGAPLHTNFKLATEGEYLALVAPDGTNAVSEFAPTFRAQFPNVSFGLAPASVVTLLAPTAPARVRVPANDAAGIAWRSVGFDDSGWTAGTGGVGYETSPADYAGLIGTDVRTAMANNASCYVRFGFNVDNPAALSRLRLLVQYDDGFVAWLNGREVARRNAPAALSWNSAASADHPDSLAVVAEEIDVSGFASALLTGDNVLAVQGLNVSLTSSDFLVRVGLEADRDDQGTAEAYFTTPTPGEANRGGVAALGPLISEVAHSPAQPAAANTITVTAKVERTFAPVSSVTLFRRVMFNAETSAAMFDDGQHGDGAAGDGVFGAVIPANTATAGQMLRYRIVAADNTARESQLPLYFNAVDSEQYLGLVIADPSITSSLPIVHLFVQNVGASEGFGGTRASLAFLGEFYDNISIGLHGQSSSGFPKKSFNLDFNRDHRFRYATNQSRVKDIKLLTNYGDKSRLHNTLAYEVIRDAGSIGHFAFHVRVQRNAAFHGILDFVEDPDDRWLERVGLDPEGALYKVYDALDSAGGSEKKTRKQEGSADLQALISGLAESRPLATRATYAYDNVDLPQTVSYFVGLALTSSQDHGHKNFYAFRDSTGSGDWTMFPWDVDLTFGRNWLNSSGYFTDTLYTNNVLNFYNNAQQEKPANRFYNLIFNHPDFRRMYLRRLRTVMDELLQSPDTPAAELRIEARIRELLDVMDPPNVAQSDTDLDEAKWGSWGTRRTTRAEAQRIADVYLPGRRKFLFNSASATVSGERIPAAQSTNAVVLIDQLDFLPTSGRQTEEFVRLTNAEPVAVDISGWQLRGQVTHTFRPGTVIPAGRTLHAARDVAGFRNRATSPKRGENAFVQGNYRGQLSARGGSVELVDPAGRVVSTFAYAGNPTVWQRQLRISEIMFYPLAPAPGSPFEDEDFEFLELKNVGPKPLNLAGVRFTEGVLFTFTNGPAATIPAGGRVLVVRNAAAFASRYGVNLPVAGEYLGNLANEGETLRLEDAVGEVVWEFHYDDAWFATADGGGRSLEPVSPESDLDVAAGWRATEQTGGSPGRTCWSPPLESFGVANGQFVVRFRGEAGNDYELESSGSLAAAGWLPASASVSGVEGSLLELSAPMSAINTAMFFRVVPR